MFASMRRRVILSALVASLGMSALHAPHALAGSDAGPSPLSTRLDKAVDTALAQQRIVGTVVVVLENGHLVYNRPAGLADRESGRAMSVDTVFRLASVSKTVVTTVALALVDQGRLSLDDPVTKWLPGFAPAYGSTRPRITIRELMTHTAGLSYPFLEPADSEYSRAGISSGLDQPGLSFDDELRRIASAPLPYPPDAEWHYSVGIDVLGAVVAAAGHGSLPAVTRRIVTQPLHLRSLAFSAARSAPLAVPYYNSDTGPRRMAEPQDVVFPGIGTIRFSPERVFHAASFPSGGAGMVATAGEFARLLEGIRTGGSPVLRSRTAQSMMQDQLGTRKNPLGAGWGFGFGGAVVLDPDAAKTPQSKGTWTWSGVYGNSWFVDPVRGLTVVAFTNTAPEGDSGAFTTQIRDAVYGQ